MPAWADRHPPTTNPEFPDYERTMKQIGDELGVNESRVSQIHKTALEKLGVALRGLGYGSVHAFLEESNN